MTTIHGHRDNVETLVDFFSQLLTGRTVKLIAEGDGPVVKIKGYELDLPNLTDIQVTKSRDGVVFKLGKPYVKVSTTKYAGKVDKVSVRTDEIEVSIPWLPDQTIEVADP